MKRNPFTITLGIVAFVMMAVGAILWISGMRQTSSYYGDPVPLFAASSSWFSAGGLAALIWLAVLALTWQRPAGDGGRASPAIGFVSRPTSD